MQYEEIRDWIRKRPYVPFRIRLQNGRTYDSYYAGSCGLAGSDLHIGIPPSDGSHPWAIGTVIVPIASVEQIQAIENPVLHPILRDLAAG